MADWSGQGPRRWVVIICSLVASLVVGGSAAPALAAAGPSVAARAPDAPLTVLQLNLCNSGLAGCFTGRSVAKAVAVIRAEEPDVVTLNEVCEGDLPVLERALADGARDGAVVSAFRAAKDRRTGGAFLCRNGRPYGIGMVVRRDPDVRDHSTFGGIFPTQDMRDPEERAWLCVDARTGVTACTTHLANSSRPVARAQCGYLLGTAIPAGRVRNGSATVVLGGDLNLRFDGVPRTQSCLPTGVRRVDDDDVQNVVTTPEFEIVSRRLVSMGGTTDHPGLLVELKAS
jgi:Endonuclease/Exonuclease/phosphatase family